MMQKMQARSTDRKVIVGSVGSSSKLTTFRTRSGMLENSSESKSYCGSSIEADCSFVTLMSFSSESLSVTLDMAEVFSFAGVAILVTIVKTWSRQHVARYCYPEKTKSSTPRKQPTTSYTAFHFTHPLVATICLGKRPCLSFDQRSRYTHRDIPFLIRQHAIVDQNEIYAGHAIFGTLVSWFVHLIEG